jgi:hypothetical protein
MVEDMIDVGNGNISRTDFANRAHDVVRFHVALNILFTADYKYARMVSLSFAKQFMEKGKVLIIVGEQHPLFANGVAKVDRICDAGNAEISRQTHIVPRMPQKLDEYAGDAIVVQI